MWLQKQTAGTGGQQPVCSGSRNLALSILLSGNARKMTIELDSPASYSMHLGEDKLAMNQFLGQALQLEFTGRIDCLHCQRKTSKSFAQGYCWPCFKSLARCDSCIM